MRQNLWLAVEKLRLTAIQRVTINHMTLLLWMVIGEEVGALLFFGQESASVETKEFRYKRFSLASGGFSHTNFIYVENWRMSTSINVVMALRYIRNMNF